MLDFNPDSYTKRGMPKAADLLQPALEAVRDINEPSLGDITNYVVKKIHLPESLAQLTYKKRKNDYIIKKRVSWACNDLKTAGLVIKKRNMPYQITEQGAKLLNSGVILDGDTILNISTFIANTRSWKNADYILPKTEEKSDVNTSSSVKATVKITHTKQTKPNFKKIESELKELTDKQNQDIEVKLLNRLYCVDPFHLEEMMTTLLSEMGYKGVNGNALTTRKSNDGGIDGIINQDALGLNTIYIQVKRYAKDNTVSRPEIDSFVGALRRVHASRGVFITTSSFTQGALEAGNESSIAMIDGQSLAKLMLRYQVGVQIKHTYSTYQIDSEFFE